MKLLVLIIAFLAVASSDNYEEEEKKYHQSVATTFEEHLLPFNKRLALEANHYTKGHFIISPHNIWYNLSPEIESHKELYSFMNLPEDESVRKQIYSRALQVAGLGEHFSFSRSQAIAVDETVDVKKEWHTFIEPPNGMPDYFQSLAYEKPFGHVQSYIENYQPVPYSGHAVLLDHVMFDDVWNSAFSANPVQHGPFYNDHGEQVAKVEYFRMKGIVNVAHSPDSKIKVLEVPTDENRFMLLAVGGEPEEMIETVFNGHILSDLKQTEEPIDVVVPKLSMSSAIEMGQVFGNMRRNKEFSVSANKGYKDDLPEFPRDYYHMVTVNVTESLDRSSSGYKDSSNEEIDFAALEKEGFYVNKPFLFALYVPIYKSTVKVPVFTGVFSYPGERGQKKI